MTDSVPLSRRIDKLAVRLQPFYRAARVDERVLLTGHSHQAWPDVALEGLKESFVDATSCLDKKWERAFAKAESVRHGYRRLLGSTDAELALFQNTFDAIVAWLSALPLVRRPHLVTSDAEFHSLRRLLQRLEEEGVVVDRIPARPVATLAERYSNHLAQLRAKSLSPAAAFCSSVLFESSEIVPGLDLLAAEARRCGVPLLLDTYHHLNAAPFSMHGLHDVYLVGGGYKYVQAGEGNAFLRVPNDCQLRPAITGWFAEFSALHERGAAGITGYGRGAERFSMATYDPASHYRGSAVFEFFYMQGLDSQTLRAHSQLQLQFLVQGLKEAGVLAEPGAQAAVRLVDDFQLHRVGGFLALRTAQAQRLNQELESAGVMSDYRGEFLRLGPAPYVSSVQLQRAVDALAAAIVG